MGATGKNTSRLVVVAMMLAACRTGGGRQSARPPADSAYAGVQARGAVAMGVNQYTSRHIFEPLPDGGRIELQREATDSAGSAQIRRHMALIAERFAAGDFTLPGFVHARGVPGTEVMSARRAAISYTVDWLPRGAALRLQSADSAAVEAIHAFLAFQRKDHHAGAQRDS
ncbi:MAG: hypothetical protein ABJC36_06065 [Gemmatimonadales bacterium]